MKKQPERTAMTRSILIDTFLELSKEKPLDKITVSEICSKAGYNRSTFYQYFSDTRHLLSDIGEDLMLYIKDTVINQVGKAHPESYFIESFIHIYEEKRYVLKLLLGDNPNSFSVKLKETMIPLFSKQMQMPIGDEETIYKLDFYLSGIISMVSRWVTSEPAMPPEQYALITRQIVEGMRKSGLFPSL